MFHVLILVQTIMHAWGTNLVCTLVTSVQIVINLLCNMNVWYTSSCVVATYSVCVHSSLN